MLFFAKKLKKDITDVMFISNNENATIMVGKNCLVTLHFWRQKRLEMRQLQSLQP